MEGVLSATPRVVFVLSKFPCYDEAFLLRELHEIARRVDSHVFSLRRSRDPVVHDQARELLGRTLYVPYLLSARLWRAQLALLLGRPLRYLGALSRLVAGNLKSPEFLLKNLVFFPKAAYLAHWSLQNGITHIHAGWATYPASVALAASEIAGLPFSFAAHAHDIYLDQTHLAYKLRRARFVTTCTAANRDALRRLVPDCEEQRVALVRHGLRLEAFGAAAHEPGPLSILSVGTLNPHKGFEYLIEALALLALDGLDFRCAIVGGGPLEPELRARIDAAGLGARVQLTGALAQKDVIAHYARASVFVLMAQPEWHWGVPNVIVEALASRNAVVTTRFGSVEELVRQEETGLLVPPKDAQALAGALRRLAGDPPLRERLADAGQRAVASDFQLERCAAAYVERFQGRA